MELKLIDVKVQRAEAAACWQALCAQADHSYYLSWGWVENWLTSAIEQGADLELAVLHEAGAAVGAFFLGRGRSVRRKVISSRGLFLNATGIPALDATYIEFNSILLRPGYRPAIADLIAQLPGGWDELVLPGLDRDAYPGDVLWQAPAPYLIDVKRDTRAYFADLAAVRAGGDYLAQLRSNTRAQVRRTRRLYETQGAVSVEVADSLAAAEETFERLLQLHRQMWRERGRDSNFATDCVVAFHRRLIRSRFDSGEIQLLRVNAGDATVGCLYNFVYGGRVYAYQSGFRFEPDNRFKPGLLCHCAAVEYNAAGGQSSYEFLAGDSQYKQSLGTGSRHLTWLRVQRPLPRFWLERRAMAANRFLKQLVKRRDGVTQGA